MSDIPINVPADPWIDITETKYGWLVTYGIGLSIHGSILSRRKEKAVTKARKRLNKDYESHLRNQQTIRLRGEEALRQKP